MNAAIPPLPPPLRSRSRWLARARGLLVWGFAISLAVHLCFGPLLANYKPVRSENEDVQQISVTQKIKVVIPTPSPTPTPAPQHSASPVKAAPAPPANALKLNVVHTQSKNASGPSERSYAAPVSGSENGAPGGKGNGDSAGGSTQTPTPPPACASEHIQATVIKKADVEYPEQQLEQGVTGEVDVEVSLDEKGNITGLSIFRSSHNVALDNAAMNAARDSTYSPEQIQCKPAPGSYLFHVIFGT